MLGSENSLQRSKGWAALVSAYPELAKAISDYGIFDSVEECQRKTSQLRAAAKLPAAPDPAP